MDDLQAIVGRLASGSAGRTEADIQPDVRKFLLDAPLDLNDGQLPDVFRRPEVAQLFRPGGTEQLVVEGRHVSVQVPCGGQQVAVGQADRMTRAQSRGLDGDPLIRSVRLDAKGPDRLAPDAQDGRIGGQADQDLGEGFS